MMMGMIVTYPPASGGGGGFATFDGTPTSAFITLSNGNLTVTKNTAGNSGQVGSTLFRNSGKFYFEIAFGQKSSGTAHSLGIVLSTATVGDLSSGVNCVAVQPGGASFIYSNNASTSIDLGTAASGNVFGFAIDLTGRRAWIRRNSGNWNADAAANPATGVNGVVIAAGSFAPAVYLSTAALNDSVTGNFGQSAYANAAPAGFGNWS